MPPQKGGANMFIYTQDKTIVNVDMMEVITINNDTNNLVAVASDGTPWRLCECENEQEARQEIQKIMTAIDHGRNVYYIGEFELPF
jgi:signal transduction histidine kinase